MPIYCTFSASSAWAFNSSRLSFFSATSEVLASMIGGAFPASFACFHLHVMEEMMPSAFLVKWSRLNTLDSISSETPTLATDFYQDFQRGNPYIQLMISSQETQRLQYKRLVGSLPNRKIVACGSSCPQIRIWWIIWVRLMTKLDCRD